ncbi:J domain-containing protein [Schumannella soli]|uniref:J domain-containing protein n=1 Tax=Schumannella soli TaxID=2590779 RepID=A0A506Y228_9MICO|nr:J domain-containing protein [Schumannella soli]TPW75018.1 J domain-containing protein [Schumannella soli]
MTPDEAEDVLGVTPGATLEEIERAFRKLARATHPDLLTADAHPDEVRDASERFNRAQAARDLLRDELTRPAFAILSGPYAAAGSSRRGGGLGDERPFADPADELAARRRGSSPRSRFAPPEPDPAHADVDLSDLPDDPTATLADLAADPARWAPPPPVDEREEVELSPLPTESAEPVRPTGESYWMPPAASGDAETAAAGFASHSGAPDAAADPEWDGAAPAVSRWVPSADEKLTTGEIEAQRVRHRRRRERLTIALGTTIALIGIVVGVLVAVNPQLFHDDPQPVTFPAAVPQKPSSDASTAGLAFDSTPADTSTTDDCSVAGECWAWTITSSEQCTDGTMIATVTFADAADTAPTQHRKYAVAGLAEHASGRLVVQRWPGSPDFAQVERIDCV